MEATTMGRVVVEATVESLEDLWDVRKGRKQADQVRRVVIQDALVDTGAVFLSMPTRLIRQLGLQETRRRRFLSSLGAGEASIFDAVHLTIQGRDCVVDVAEVPDEVPVLIGQVPLELLDFVVDPTHRRLIGNPAHGGEQMFEMY
jgi:predicted aspartyl protease